MFDNFQLFSSVFWFLATLLLLLILFEKKLIAYEDKKRAEKKREARIKELEEENSIHRYLIGNMAERLLDLNEKLKAQKRVNSINLESLRQERLKNSKEVKANEN